MNILLKLEVEDWENFQLYVDKEIFSSVKPWVNNFWLNILFWGVFGYLSKAFLHKTGGIHWPTFTIVFVFFILIIILNTTKQAKIKQSFTPSESGGLFKQNQYYFNEKGIKITSQDFESNQGWSTVQRIVRAEGMILVFIDKTFAYIFPETKLENPDELYSYLNEQFERHK